MTPKEKARQLVDRFRNEFKWVESDYQIDLYRDTKQCALIAVDELIDCSIYNATWASQVKYWKEVKQEIKKL